MTAVRFDLGEIKKPVQMQGMLVAEATFARDGVLEYRTPTGQVVREYRPSEENEKAIAEFGLVPVTIEHPSELVTEDNAPQYRRGVSLQNVKYGKGGFVRGEVLLLDSDAIALATSGQKVELSAGYTCNLEHKPGVWVDSKGVMGPAGKQYKYDAIQRDLKVNHIALTTRGRAGPGVRLHLDSDDSPDSFAYQVSPDPLPQKRMATLRVDNMEFTDIPEAAAVAINGKLQLLSKLDSLESAVKEKDESLSDLEDQISDLESERDRERGRADATEICLTNAEAILSEMGYRRDGNGDYYQADGYGKKKMMDESDMEDEDMEDDEEEEVPAKKHKGKKRSMDSADDAEEVRIDAKQLAKELAAAWLEADELVRTDSGAAFSEEYFDSADSPSDVRRLVVEAWYPDLNLQGKSEGYIDGIYDALREAQVEPEEMHSDSAVGVDYTGILQDVVSASRSSAGRSQLKTAEQEHASAVQNNWEKPLSLSK